jgi:hypothetical protein
VEIRATERAGGLKRFKAGTDYRVPQTSRYPRSWSGSTSMIAPILIVGVSRARRFFFHLGNRSPQIRCNVVNWDTSREELCQGNEVLF